MVFFRNLFFKLLYKLGVGKLLLSINRSRKRIPILVLHKVIPEYDPIWPGVHPRVFEDIIVLLKKHYVIKPLSDLYTFPRAHSLTNACFITFDDGYKDFLEYAYPILKRHQTPATLFVLPYQITNMGHIWTSTIVFFIKHYSFAEVDRFFKQQGVVIRYRDPDNDFKLNLDITTHLCAMTQVDRMRIIRNLRQKFLDDGRLIENELLSFDELRLLDPALAAVASHSLTHPSFSNEQDKDLINRELMESKRIIEHETGQEVFAFAFPFANYNAASLTAAKEIYRLCFTRMNDFVDLERFGRDVSYLYDLPRFNVHHNTAEEVFFLINGFHRMLRH